MSAVVSIDLLSRNIPHCLWIGTNSFSFLSFFVSSVSLQNFTLQITKRFCHRAFLQKAKTA